MHHLRRRARTRSWRPRRRSPSLLFVEYCGIFLVVFARKFDWPPFLEMRQIDHKELNVTVSNLLPGQILACSRVRHAGIDGSIAPFPTEWDIPEALQANMNPRRHPNIPQHPPQSQLCCARTDVSSAFRPAHPSKNPAFPWLQS